MNFVSAEIFSKAVWTSQNTQFLAQKQVPCQDLARELGQGWRAPSQPLLAVPPPSPTPLQARPAMRMSEQAFRGAGVSGFLGLSSSTPISVQKVYCIWDLILSTSWMGEPPISNF